MLDQGVSRGDIRFHADGKPYYQDFADRMGVDKSMISKIFRDRMDKRPGVLKPRRDFYEGSPELFRALGLWLNMDPAQVITAIYKAAPRPPFRTRGR